MDADKAHDLDAPTGGAAADDAAAADEAAWAALTRQIEEIVNDEYDLGDVIRAERIFGGYVNASFAVWTRTRDRRAQVLRAQVQPGDHGARGALRARAPHPSRSATVSTSPRTVFPNRHGGTFVTREEVVDGNAAHRLLRRLPAARGRRQVHLGQEPPDRQGVRQRRRGSSPSSITAPSTSTPATWPASSRRSWSSCPPSPARSRSARRRRRAPRSTTTSSRKLPAILDVIAKGVEVESPARRSPGHPGALRLPPRQPEVGGRAGRGPVRLRLVQARLPRLRRRPGRRVLLQLLGRTGQGASCASTRRRSSCAPTRTRRRAGPTPGP